MSKKNKNMVGPGNKFSTYYFKMNYLSPKNVIILAMSYHLYMHKLLPKMEKIMTNKLSLKLAITIHSYINRKFSELK